MKAIKRDLYIEQGATFVLPFQWCENSGTEDEPVAGDPHDLTGFSARMQIRQKQHTPILVDATSANSKIIIGRDPSGTVDPETGWITVLLSAEDTDLITHKKAKYDLELEDGDGVVYRLLQGDVTVDPNITQDTTEDPEVEE